MRPAPVPSPPPPPRRAADVWARAEGEALAYADQQLAELEAAARRLAVLQTLHTLPVGFRAAAGRVALTIEDEVRGGRTLLAFARAQGGRR